MARYELIVVGASAGGVDALQRLTAGLSEPLPVPILVVLHTGALPSTLPSILNSAGMTPAKHAEDGEGVMPGQLYVAPPDRHMIIVDGRVHLSRGPKENRTRPAIDPLFRSAAETYGSAAVGVILTGRLNDGTDGLYAIKRRGGMTIVQDPNDAVNADMPKSAAAHVNPDYCLPLAQIPALLVRLVTEKGVKPPDHYPLTPEKGHDMSDDEKFQRPLALTCPDCGGALRRTEIGTIIKYTCHIGHAYTAETMAAAQFDTIEKTLRAAERSLNERAEFCRQMADRLKGSGSDGAAWHDAGQEATDRAYNLRSLIEQHWTTPDLQVRRK